MYEQRQRSRQLGALSGGRGRECTTGVANGSVSVAQRIFASTKSSYSLRRPPNRYANAREYGSGFARRKTGASYSSTLAQAISLKRFGFCKREPSADTWSPSSRFAPGKISARGWMPAWRFCYKQPSTRPVVPSDVRRSESTDYLSATRISDLHRYTTPSLSQKHCSPKSVATALRRRSDPERCRP